MLAALILLVTLSLGLALAAPRVAQARLWRATVTPLASIIGSGFLVLGPIMDASYGAFAPLVMAGLCGGAYLFGAAIRENIASRASGEPAQVAERLDTCASWVLAFAYVISVAYYLNLLGAFAVHSSPVDDEYHAKLLTTATYLVILAVGVTRGFGALERLEQISVCLKLAIIGGMLFGLGWHFVETAAAGELLFNPPNLSGMEAVTLAFGLIVTVQGFETSRYLGEEYDAATRIRSMRLAQILSTAIYMSYVLLIAYVFEPEELSLDETGIIEMMAIIAPVLSTLLVVAALSAQFSAAIADTNGSGGLVAELSGQRITTRTAYALLVAIGLIITWTSNVFEIISYASRAFAVYYAIQAWIAAATAWRKRRTAPGIGYAALGILGIAIAILGTPVE